MPPTRLGRMLGTGCIGPAVGRVDRYCRLSTGGTVLIRLRAHRSCRDPKSYARLARRNCTHRTPQRGCLLERSSHVIASEEQTSLRKWLGTGEKAPKLCSMRGWGPSKSHPATAIQRTATQLWSTQSGRDPASIAHSYGRFDHPGLQSPGPIARENKLAELQAVRATGRIWQLAAGIGQNICFEQIVAAHRYVEWHPGRKSGRDYIDAYDVPMFDSLTRSRNCPRRNQDEREFCCAY